MAQKKDSPESKLDPRELPDRKMVRRLIQMRVLVLVGLICLVPAGIAYLRTPVGYLGLVLNLALIYHFLKELTYEP
jgi:hypothetical protein